MRPLALAGLLLIVLGIAGLVFEQFSYTTDKKVVDVGPIQASVAERHYVNVPNIAGVTAVAAGLLLVVFSRRRA